MIRQRVILRNYGITHFRNIVGSTESANQEAKTGGTWEGTIDQSSSTPNPKCAVLDCTEDHQVGGHVQLIMPPLMDLLLCRFYSLVHLRKYVFLIPLCKTHNHHSVTGELPMKPGISVVPENVECREQYEIIS